MRSSGKRLGKTPRQGQAGDAGGQTSPDGQGASGPPATWPLPTGIEATPGVCGGDPRIAGTRIPVWSLASARRMGATDAQLLDEYPSLALRDLANAWSYAESHPDEIDRLIHENEVA